MPNYRCSATPQVILGAKKSAIDAPPNEAGGTSEAQKAEREAGAHGRTSPVLKERSLTYQALPLA
jgi:hypothetical protein